jgi:hypothetical protein
MDTLLQIVIWSNLLLDKAIFGHAAHSVHYILKCQNQRVVLCYILDPTVRGCKYTGYCCDASIRDCQSRTSLSDRIDNYRGDYGSWVVAKIGVLFVCVDRWDL